MMRSDLDHLPPGKRRDLARVVEILHAEFDEALALATTKWKRQGRIQRIILFGSYARGAFADGVRGGWVDEPHTMKGYRSDYDILIIVSHKGLTDIVDYWLNAEDRLMREPSIKPMVNFIVHTMAEVNDALRKGQYFYSDIIREGIVLYELKGAKPFAEPVPLTSPQALAAAEKHFAHWLPSAREFLAGANFYRDRGSANEAAFSLHQSVERAYHCILLTLTNYSPNSHNIEFLRGLTEQLDARLIDVWPRTQKKDRRFFQLLKRAYVEARYSDHYVITQEELDWLAERTDALHAIAATLCEERIAALKRA